jgi:putative ABC transport system permease protein
MAVHALFDGVRPDLEYALRGLVRHPSFTAVAVLALALGIGANVMVFTLANAFLFKNLPFDDSERIVYVSSTNPSRPGNPRGMSYPDFLDCREQARSFEGAGLFTTGSVDVSDGVALPERYRSALLTAGAFGVIGQTTLRGRDFVPGDEAFGAPAVAILSYQLWQGRYNGDDAIIGRTLRINDRPTEVVGIMAKGVTFPGATDLWMPLTRTKATERRDSRNLTMFGRLAAGASLPTVRNELSLIAGRLTTAYPATNRDIGVLAQNFNERFNGGATSRLFVWLLWAVGFVLLIACANVANLLLARAIARARDVSIRASLGASRWRIIRHLLIESLALATAAAAVGWLLAMWGVRVFDAALLPAVKPPYIDFSIDYRVIAYLVAITFATAIAFGLVPALQVSRLNINTVLKEGNNAAGPGRRVRLVSALLVIVEVSLSVLLLAGAGLMARSLLNTNRVDIGLDPSQILSMSLNLRTTKYPTVEQRAMFYDQLTERLERLPTIEGASVASDLPAESPDDFAYDVEGGRPAESDTRPRTMSLVVGENYFRVIGAIPRAGRVFERSDTAGRLPVAIINEAFVNNSWPGEDPIGKRVRLVETSRDAPPSPGPWLTVVGVVRDILQDDESFEVSPVVYVPYRQQPTGVDIMVRTRVPPATVSESIRREVQALDGDLAVRGLRPLEESLWLRNWRYRVFGVTFAIFAAIALALASLGLYAVVAHSVSLRTREIGVRMTLGASSRSILALVFRQGMTPLGAGLVVGVAAALAATSVLRAMLVGVTPADPTTFGLVAVILACAGVLGCAIPARRALRVDPVIALRRE